MRGRRTTGLHDVEAVADVALGDDGLAGHDLAALELAGDVLERLGLERAEERDLAQQLEKFTECSEA